MDGISFAIPVITKDELSPPVLNTVMSLYGYTTDQELDDYLTKLNAEAEGFILSFINPSGTVVGHWLTWKTMYIDYTIFSKVERDDISEDKMKILITALQAFGNLQVNMLALNTNIGVNKKLFVFTNRSALT